MATRRTRRLTPLRNVALAAVLSLAVSGCADAAEVVPQNLVVVLVDTLRADHLSLYGHDRETAPTLRDFAREAAVFRRARSQAACTFPSVNSILTSRHPVDLLARLDGYGMAIPDDVPTLAELLGGGGWSTAAVSASMIVRDTPSNVNQQGGFGRGFETFHEACLDRGGRAPCVNERALRLLDELPEPFFLYLHYMDPHAPYRPAPWHERRFATEPSDRRWIRQGEPRRIFQRLYEGDEGIEFGEDDLGHFVDLYDEEILFFDSQLAVLLEGIEDRGLSETTIVALLSDHGEELMDHGEFGHCRDMAYETLLATPLILRIPGVVPAVIDTPVRNLDLMPTLLDFLEVSHDPDDFDGGSLRALLEGDDRALFRYDFAAQGTLRTVTDGHRKLIHDLETGESSLFDLDTDPAELVDLAAAEPQEALRLLEILLSWLESRQEGQGTSDAVRRAREHDEVLRAVGYL